MNRDELLSSIENYDAETENMIETLIVNSVYFAHEELETTIVWFDWLLS